MEIDPLADHPPPRHALESDSEDELASPPRRPEQTLVFRPSASAARAVANDRLLVMMGEAAIAWENIFQLDEEAWKEVGSLLLDEVEIGRVYDSAGGSNKTSLLILNGSSKLSVYSYRSLANLIIKDMKYKRLTILDSYAIPSYIPSPSDADSNPDCLRHLSNVTTPSKLKLRKFSPPNLLSSPTASILSLALLQIPPIPATAILLPGKHIPPPPVYGVRGSGSVMREDWEPNVVESAVEAACADLGLDYLPGAKRREGKKGSTRGGARKSSFGVGDGGMYI